MSNNIDTHIETEARERTRLRYEAIFWGALTAVLAITAVGTLFAASGILSTAFGIGLAVGALASYIKRDETVEEYNLKMGSGHSEIAAKHWAQELGLNKLIGKAAPMKFINKTKDQNQPDVTNTAAPKQETKVQDHISQQNIVQKITKENETKERADGKSWAKATDESKQAASANQISK